MMVTLVGAGPGDKGLMTIKGYKRVRAAEVIVYDRHVSDEILAMIPETVEMIDVGKNAGNHPVPQEEINKLILEKAMQGFNVVRLKGGDPFIFGRGGEELEFLASSKIPFEVVPGVTSAAAGAAYAGIPLTHRNYVSSLHIITGHGRKGKNPEINYDALVGTRGTLVFVMGVATVNEISAGCLKAGMDENMPAAVIENATVNKQRKFLGTVGDLPDVIRDNAVKSPAIIIIGKVCLLSRQLDWFSKKPLLGKSIVVARARPGTSTLSDQLRDLGCCVIETPHAKITHLISAGCDLEKALKNINDYSWLIFTSIIGVNVFFDYLFKTGIDIRSLHHLKIACVGSETEKEVLKRGIRAEYCPSEYSGEALAIGLSEIVEKGERLLIARAKDGAEDLTRILTDKGIVFDDVHIYEKACGYKNISIGDTDTAAFTSSSSVKWFAGSAGTVDLASIRAICIGKRTAATARSFGMKVYLPEEATVESMIKKIEEIFVL